MKTYPSGLTEAIDSVCCILTQKKSERFTAGLLIQAYFTTCFPYFNSNFFFCKDLKHLYVSEAFECNVNGHTQLWFLKFCPAAIPSDTYWPCVKYMYVLYVFIQQTPLLVSVDCGPSPKVLQMLLESVCPCFCFDLVSFMFGMYICFCNPCLEGTHFVFHSHFYFTIKCGCQWWWYNSFETVSNRWPSFIKEKK